jgi:hypothetical protein
MFNFQIHVKCRKVIICLVVSANGVNCIQPVFAESSTDIQQKIEAQRAENVKLKEKIAEIEKVLKTDVCSNPEASKLLESDNEQSSSNANYVK